MTICNDCKTQTERAVTCQTCGKSFCTKCLYLTQDKNPKYRKEPARQCFACMKKSGKEIAGRVYEEERDHPEKLNKSVKQTDSREEAEWKEFDRFIENANRRRYYSR